MIQVKQALSRPGGTTNEDRIWYEDGFLALLDGSSSLVPSGVGGDWFTECFVRGLEQTRAEKMTERINQALAYVEEEFTGTFPGRDLLFYPSAAGVFVQEKEDFLDVIAIGDCEGHFIMKDGRVITVTDEAVTRLDQTVFDLCRQLQKERGGTIAELMKTEEARSLLIANRKKMNQPDGYRILSIGMEPCREEELIRIPKWDVARIVLFSDGFAELKDQLRQPDADLEDLYRKLRRMEADDPDFETMPRFKPGDDASALIAELI